MAAKSTVRINENIPNFVFIKKRGSIENTSLSGVSVIMEQCRIRWAIFVINVNMESKNITRTAVSPQHLFFPSGIEISAPEGVVIKILDERAPVINTIPERKNQ
jgi:hypothetical protein